MDNWTCNEEKVGVKVGDIVDELHDCAIELSCVNTPDELYNSYLDIKNICAKLYMFSYKRIFEN